MTGTLTRLPPLQRRILRTVIWRGPLSRVELARRLGSSRSRLSPEIASMLAGGFLVERGSDLSTGGRRGARLAPGGIELAVLVGADIDASGIAVVVTTLDGTIVARDEERLATVDDPASTLALTAEMIERCLSSLSSGHGPLAAIGISISADVDPPSGRVASAPTMPNWVGVPVGDYFAARFLVRVFVDNDVNVLALAEASTHGAEGRLGSTFLVVKISSGVGCGIVIDGTVFRGSSGFAGDIGHICADPADPTLCACGNRGCLEAFAAAPAIIREAERLAYDDPNSFIGRLLSAGEHLTLDRISGAAQAGDPTVARLLRTIGARIGFVLAGLVSFFNPSTVVVRSGIPGGEDILLNAIRQAIYERSLAESTRNLSIVHSQFGDDAGATGAAVLAGQGFFGAAGSVAESRPRDPSPRKATHGSTPL